MTEERLLRLARVMGQACPEALTLAELEAALSLAGERERRFFQHLSVLAYHHAVLTARALGGGQLPCVAEAFPFWTQKERDAAKLAQVRQRLERWSGSRAQNNE